MGPTSPREIVPWFEWNTDGRVTVAILDEGLARTVSDMSVSHKMFTGFNPSILQLLPLVHQAKPQQIPILNMHLDRLDDLKSYIYSSTITL